MTTKQQLNHLNRTAVKLSLILSALALPLITQAGQEQKKQRVRYKLVDLGTLGGRGSSVTGPSNILNHRGTVVGGADTPNPIPLAQTVSPPAASSSMPSEGRRVS
jgi:hypothetical protein